MLALVSFSLRELDAFARSLCLAARHTLDAACVDEVAWKLPPWAARDITWYLPGGQ